MKCNIIHGDALQILDEIKEESIDCIFADPPYFLSNDGVTCKGGKMVSVNKGDWDKSQGLKNDFEFTLTWLKKARRVLDKDGTIWVSGTHHNIHQVGFALQKLGYKILNEITWFKPNAPPNLSCKYFTHSHETLLWAAKSKNSNFTFNYQKMKQWPANKDKVRNKGTQMRSVWSIPLTPPSEKKHGKHPTQKPLELLRRCILSSTNKGDIVLDPFCGSGTTGVVSVNNQREFIGIERESDYIQVIQDRLKVTRTQTNLL